MKLVNLIPINIKEQNPCWKGYQMVGTKKKNGKDVPNCVPNKTVKENTNVNRENQITDIDQEFAKFVESTAELDTYKRQEGTDSLDRLYREATPEQTEESCGCTKEQQKEGKSPVVPDDLDGPNIVKEPLYEIIDPQKHAKTDTI